MFIGPPPTPLRRSHAFTAVRVSERRSTPGERAVGRKFPVTSRGRTGGSGHQQRARRCPAPPATAAISPGATMCTAPTPAAERRERLLQLGDHPALDDAVGDRRARLGDGQAREARRRIVHVAPHAAHAGAARPAPRRPAAAASWLATTSALMFSDLAARRRRRGRRSPAGSPGAASASSSARSKPVDVADRARSRPAPPPAAGDHARRPPVRAHDAARPRAARRPRTPAAAQRRDQIDVELAGDHHLHHVERRRVGDAPAADQPRLDAQPPRQLRRLRPAAVDDDEPRARRRARAGESAATAASAGARQHLAAQLDRPASTTATAPDPRATRSRAGPASGSCSGSPARRRP